MERDKPLHVRVAEALGCNGPKYYVANGAWHCRCGSYEHAIGGEESDTSEIQHYDTDWSATGPLIEKYGWTVGQFADRRGYCAFENAMHGVTGIGPTPLVAVCNLILALHAAGKLKAA